MKKTIDKYSFVLFSIFLGMITFIVIYGVEPLDVTNDCWIMQGYDESDIIQHYAGWTAFRNSPWRFPLGMTDYMGTGDGAIISFTDSIPWVAMICKLFRRFLPQTFQYFGWYTLFCYILQGVAASQLIYYKTQDRIYTCVGAVFFCFSPVLMERSFRHTALASHWFVLFSILFYLKYRDTHHKRIYFYFGLMTVLAVGIHPYFLPMIFAFVFLCMIEDFQRHSYRSVLYLTVQLVSTCLAGYLIGVLGYYENSSREGFGFYSMNINAPVNPSSCGGYDWSVFLPVRQQTLGNYDGFNYVGAGIIVMAVAMGMLVLVYWQSAKVIKTLRNNVQLLVVSIVLTLYALSNVVTYDDKVLFTMPLPDTILNLCGIFRASSRLFYPVSYLVTLLLLLILWYFRTKLGKKTVRTLLILFVFVQLWDLHNVIIEKHLTMGKNARTESVLQDEMLQTIARSADYLLEVDFVDHVYNRKIAVWAYRNDMETYFTVATVGRTVNCKRLAEQAIEEIRTTGRVGKYVVATTNKETADRYSMISSAGVYQYENVYFIYDAEGME